MNTIVKTSSFSNQSQPGILYVDKTINIYKLSQLNGFFTFSRPRWFGLSQLLDSLTTLFQGKRSSFKDLELSRTDYSWKQHPVIRIDFSICAHMTPQGMRNYLAHMMRETAAAYTVTISNQLSGAALYSETITALSKISKVVVLIDEVDSPLRLNADKNDINEFTDIYRKLFSAFASEKDCLRFCFIVGTIPLSRGRLSFVFEEFTDLTFSDDYNSLCGYTQKEMEENFAYYIDKGIVETGMDRASYLAEIREWFGGYLFSPHGECVYHPGFIASFFLNENGTCFKDYWGMVGSIGNTLKEKAQALDLTGDGEFRIFQKELQTVDIIKLMQPAEGEKDLIRLFYYYGYLTIKNTVYMGEDYLLTLSFTNNGMKENLCYLLTCSSEV